MSNLFQQFIRKEDEPSGSRHVEDNKKLKMKKIRECSFFVLYFTTTKRSSTITVRKSLPEGPSRSWKLGNRITRAHISGAVLYMFLFIPLTILNELRPHVSLSVLVPNIAPYALFIGILNFRKHKTNFLFPRMEAFL